MNELYKLFDENKYINKVINDNKVVNCGSNETLAFYVAYQYYKSNKSLVLVMENLYACQIMYNKLANMIDDVYMYSVDEVTKLSSLASSCELASSRIFILNKLINNDRMIVVTHTMAVNRIVPTKEIFIKNILNIKIDTTYNMLDLIGKLIKLGYKNVYQVTAPFEYSTRGGVVDIFSINYKNPVRIEFFDDFIDSIRFFDVNTQRTITTAKEVNIIPACEFLVDDVNSAIDKINDFLRIQINQSDKNLQLEAIKNEEIEELLSYNFTDSMYKYYSFYEQYGNLSEYLYNCEVLLVNEKKIVDNEIFHETEIFENMANDYQEGEGFKDFKLFNRFKEFKEDLKSYKLASTEVENTILDFNYVKVDTFDFNLDLLYKELINLLTNHYTVYIGLPLKVQYNSLINFFDQKDIRYHEVDNDNKIKKETINIGSQDYGFGLDFVDLKLYVIGENEIFKKRFNPKISQFSRYKDAITIDSVNDLEIGDYLVHDLYGIGIYKGIETMLVLGVHKDYINIEYKDGVMFHLPLEQFMLVRKYVSHEGAHPKINKLGSKEWEKTKEKVSQRVNDLADKLVSLYSNRANKNGFAFAPDDDLQESFENDFPYELTPDQKQVLTEIKHDMESPIIMDRLLVGDVGFGKTEIAFRAAFKAINSGKQVALLCPTTLLARQHYMTALDRFKNFGVKIALLSRKVSDKEATRIVKELKDGTIEFIIGTHRLFSEDVKFKDIGLLIVDEEHKFGVEHKEKIKEYKENIDVLTLSATPIPRTLQMALTGVRGFSTINTPISDRMPVQTYVIKKEKRIVKEVIERELARGGQVYYLYNRIDRLSTIATEIKALVKDAKIAIAHGKLSVENTEDIMQQFINGDFNILLCTTIIENGIDIPNVNTIIVENADCFGLAQLYQIKGRVGRSNRLAYAYLMYNQNKELSEMATKRLKTIREFTALGSGYKVAMRDLISRGAGDILGAEQSGFIESVGVDMYIEMLQEAIDNKKAEKEGIIQLPKKHVIKPSNPINADAYIPEDYFNNDYEKIELYKAIDKVSSFTELKKLQEKTIDITGKLPQSIKMLFEKKMIDLYVGGDVLESFVENKNILTLNLSAKVTQYKGIGIPIFEAACDISRLISLKYSVNKIVANIGMQNDFLSVACRFLQRVEIIVNEFGAKNGH